MEYKILHTAIKNNKPKVQGYVATSFLKISLLTSYQKVLFLQKKLEKVEKELIEKTVKLSLDENKMDIVEEVEEKRPRKKTKKEKERELWDPNNPKEYVEHLKALLINPKDLNYRKVPSFNFNTINFDIVREASIRMKSNKAIIFGECINFGLMLCWVKNNHNGSFEKWVKENIGLGKIQCYKYIKLVPLSEYPKFYRVSTDMSSIYDKVDDIVTYIGCNKEESLFWLEE
eukprot:gene11188-4008_t